MTVTDPRPPLYLTKDQAANWLSLHSNDIGREIIVVESPVRGLPPDVIAAWAGWGRWEAGLAGTWPSYTLFAPRLLAHPPHWIAVEGREVTIRLGGESVTYRVVKKAGRHIAPPVRDVLADDDRRPAVLVGWSRS